MNYWVPLLQWQLLCLHLTYLHIIGYLEVIRTSFISYIIASIISFLTQSHLWVFFVLWNNAKEWMNSDSLLSLLENELLCFCYQGFSGSGSWLFLLRSNAFDSSCHLHCFGNRSALPPVHMERLLTKTTLWGSACVHHSCYLPVLHSHGSEPLSQSARLKISVQYAVLHCNVQCVTGMEEGK